MADVLIPIRPPSEAVAGGIGSDGRPPGKLNLRGLTHGALAALLAKNIGAPRYRADQIFAWIHTHGVTDLDRMTNVPRRERAKISEFATVAPLEVALVQRSRDGTRKLRLETRDGASIESVLIPNEDRGLTQCVSSQVGCALTCRFCATAQLGFRRSLHAWEIVDQVHRARALLEREARRDGDAWTPRITNVVYMGMGEPLHNFNHVRDSLHILTDPRGDHIARRRITISTAGLVPAIARFVREGLADDFGLAISLNATTDATREAIMPINSRWDLDALFDVLRTVPTAKRELTFEYVLLEGINDSSADAKRLISLLRDIRCHVNLIPFNSHPASVYRPPSPARIDDFVAILRRGRLPCFLRTPRGSDIAAACGQLALDEAHRPDNAGR